MPALPIHSQMSHFDQDPRSFWCLALQGTFRPVNFTLGYYLVLCGPLSSFEVLHRILC